MQDSDYLYIAVVEYSIEQEVFACFEASQSVEYLVVAFAEELRISRYLLAGGYQHIVIVINLSLRPFVERTVPDVGKVRNILHIPAYEVLTHLPQPRDQSTKTISVPAGM